MDIRQFRIWDIAVFDLALAILGTLLLFLLARKMHFSRPGPLPALPFALAAVLLAIPLGIFAHVMFGVDTTLNYRLGLSHAPKSK
jgi:hypothetical protein